MQKTPAPINMSVFELLKSGPGPSSSHTIGPMRAGFDFVNRLKEMDVHFLSQARGVRVRLLGSLSATGEGHGTDRAVIAGLMGHDPTSCPPALLNELNEMEQDKRLLSAGPLRLKISVDNVEYGPIHHEYPYSNTLFIDLLDTPYPSDTPAPPVMPSLISSSRPDPLAGNILFSMEYYSVGGGFLQWNGWEPSERGQPPYPYATMRELQMRLEESGLSLDKLLLENETAITGCSPGQIRDDLDNILEIMKSSVRRGYEARGRLPGSIGLRRKAGSLYDRSASLEPFDRALSLLNAYAYGAAEENAAGNIIVTAPTCGSAGVLPAVAVFMQQHLCLDEAAQRKGLLAATAIGFLAKQNAGIAGAEVGCQGEVGVASAMAAAMLAHARGYSARVVENAAEIALEHHLGLTCDPVGGYVQIPCIERNAVGAVKAYNAAIIAANEDVAAHLVTYDDTLRAMAEIGRDMNSKYKETSTGGLAVCLAQC
ncbi:L-serine ammonia-lyase [Deltaproteobacteria bacterium Smac51]|nr:L-serine ammonia-lyase [Deltaproteobacteria bacterium Smac51]